MKNKIESTVSLDVVLEIDGAGNSLGLGFRNGRLVKFERSNSSGEIHTEPLTLKESVHHYVWLDGLSRQLACGGSGEDQAVHKWMNMIAKALR